MSRINPMKPAVRSTRSMGEFSARCRQDKIRSAQDSSSCAESNRDGSHDVTGEESSVHHEFKPPERCAPASTYGDGTPACFEST